MYAARQGVCVDAHTRRQVDVIIQCEGGTCMNEYHTYELVAGVSITPMSEQNCRTSLRESMNDGRSVMSGILLGNESMLMLPRLAVWRCRAQGLTR